MQNNYDANFDEFEEIEPWIPHNFRGARDARIRSKDFRFIGFTYKKPEEENKINEMVSLLDEIESQVRDRKMKKDKAMLMQNTQQASKERVPEISASSIQSVTHEHRTGGIASSSVPNIKPLSSTNASSHQAAGTPHSQISNPNFGFTSTGLTPKSQMVIVPKDKLNPAGASKQGVAGGSNVAPPKNTPISSTKLPSELSLSSKPLYVGAYTKIGGFQQRSSSNDGPTKSDLVSTQTNPLVSPRKPQADPYSYPMPLDKPAKAGVTKPGGNTAGTASNRDTGLPSKKPDPSISGGANKSSGSAIAASSKKPLNLFGLKFLSKGPTLTSGDRR